MAKRQGRGYAAVNYPTGIHLGGDPSQALIHATTTGTFTMQFNNKSTDQNACKGAAVTITYIAS